MRSPKSERQILPLIVAHRGASTDFPENTLEAFEGAVQAGADVIELDVRLTLDRVPIVLHDLDVSATTDGSGPVHGMTLKEVRRLDASGGRGLGTRIPTLRESLELLSGRAGVDVEIKNIPGEPSFDSPREEIAEQVVGLLHDVGFAGSVLVSSFNWLSIERARALDPDLLTGFLCHAAVDPFAALVYAREHGHAYVLPQSSAVLAAGEEFVQEAHLRGVLVGTWTVDDAGGMERLFRMGVDAVATNDPGMAVPIRDRFRAGPI